MIHVIAPGNEQATARLLVSALQRSCGLGSAGLGSYGLLQRRPCNANSNDVFVLIHPREEWTHHLIELLGSRAKVLVLGRMTTGLAQHLQATLAFEWPDRWAEGSLCAAAPIHGTAESTARVVYPQTGPQIAGQVL